MHWNYRIIHHDEDAHPYFGLHEVHYNDANGIMAWTEKAEIVSDSIDGIRAELAMMLNDTYRFPDVIEAKGFEFASDGVDFDISQVKAVTLEELFHLND